MKFTAAGMVAAVLLLGAAVVVPAEFTAAPATAGKLQLGPDIYKSIGVRPLINCRGTLANASSLRPPRYRSCISPTSRS